MAVLALLLTALASRGAAQAPAPLRLPWDIPRAEAAAQLQGAGFLRDTAAGPHLAPAATGGFQRIAADPGASTYTRVARGLTESVFMRGGDGAPVQLFYSAFGDSAEVRAKLDAVAADAASRLGTPTNARGLRLWRTGDGGRLTVPSHPSRLADRRHHFVVLFHHPTGQVP
jgi:hypothetical protein